MKARTKFLLGGALVIGTAGYLMASSITATGTYYLTPAEFSAKLVRDPSFAEVGIKLGARVVPGSIKRDPGGREFAFLVTDTTAVRRDTIAVLYRGLAPDTFTDNVDVVVEGRMRDGVFEATTLLAKCASRYEEAPQKPGEPAPIRSGA
jgi:cytochrome c-type biogenesis protein CcmE